MIRGCGDTDISQHLSDKERVVFGCNVRFQVVPVAGPERALGARELRGNTAHVLQVRSQSFLALVHVTASRARQIGNCESSIS